MHYLPKKKYASGQTLLAILVAIAVFAILTHATFTLIASSYDLVSYNRARITARQLAQEKIELTRNLPYQDIGTVGGIPSGILAQEETVARNNLNYLVKIDIIFVDDPFDESAPDDTSPEDYKRARVEVSWEGQASSRRNPVVLLTDVSSQASGSLDGGTLVVLVFDANGQPVPQAQVTIVANDTNPPVNLTQQTGSNGEIILPGSPLCVSCYQITVTKSGFSTDRTHSTAEVTNPVKPYTSVFQNDITQISFTIDTLGNLTLLSLDSRENNFAPLGNLAVRVRGNKIIGTDAYAQPVYKYDENFTTDASGNLTIPNIEWDIYHILSPSTPSYDISGTNPVLPLNLVPGGTIDFSFANVAHSTNSLLITSKDSSQNLIASASARLYDNLGFEKIQYTGTSGNTDFGQTLFSSLEEKTYHIEVTASGYLNFNGDFDVSGYTTTDVIMSPQ